MDDRKLKLISRRGFFVDDHQNRVYRTIAGRHARRYSRRIFERQIAAMEQDCLLWPSSDDQGPPDPPAERFAIHRLFPGIFGCLPEAEL